MILVDKEIRAYAGTGKLIVDGFQESRLNSISHDLTIDKIIDENGEAVSSKEVEPGEVVFIKTQEKLSMPDNIMGRVAEKNSRMRQGLRVDGPHYHPGHVTYCFLRVQNISSNAIVLSHGNSIAQIIFEELKERPDITYAQQRGASFNDEVEYRGLGAYKNVYEDQVRKIDKAHQDLEGLTEKIYANVLTLMGILVAIFSLITIDYQAAVNFKSVRELIAVNLSLALCISVLMGCIMVFINKAKNKKFLAAYIIILILLVVGTVCLAMSF